MLSDDLATSTEKSAVLVKPRTWSTKSDSRRALASFIYSTCSHDTRHDIELNKDQAVFR